MPELGFQYELTRSDRRTLSIKISRDAKVLVYAPRRMSLKHIEDGGKSSKCNTIGLQKPRPEISSQDIF